MLTTLTDLAPKTLWAIFTDICQIPHPSHHEQLISDYIVNFAKKHHIDWQIDHAGNILLRKPACQDYEHCPSIALQAHMDMVPQKNEDTAHDFLVDPISPYIDGEWVKAKGTTLGADNGIGLASALAVLSDADVKHGPIEVLITASEETGMFGAFGLQPNWLQSRYLINTDSEDEGQLFMGCAGGVDVRASLPITYTVIPDGDNEYVQLSLKGLKGGHSGCDIHQGYGNAITLLVRFFAEFAVDLPYHLASLQGGTLRNAIPREASALLILASHDFNQLKKRVDNYQLILKDEFQLIDPNIELILTQTDKNQVKRAISHEHSAKLIHWLHTAPNGVMRMSNEIQGVVESSLNLGIMAIDDSHAHADFLVRSQVDSAKKAIVSVLISHSQLVNAHYQIHGNYSGWKPNLQSELLQLAKEKYHDIFTKQPSISIIHAGLECGLFKQSYPDMDMISIGPTIVSPHSPDEKVHIESVTRYWDWLIAILSSAALLK